MIKVFHAVVVEGGRLCELASMLSINHEAVFFGAMAQSEGLRVRGGEKLLREGLEHMGMVQKRLDVIVAHPIFV